MRIAACADRLASRNAWSRRDRQNDPARAISGCMASSGCIASTYKPRAAMCAAGAGTGLLGDGDRVGEAVVEPHRVVLEYDEAAGHDDGIEAVLDGALGLD